MQEAGVHLAVVVDEHGGTDGIVGIEDVVSQLVGEVGDEGRVAVRPAIEHQSGRWSVDAAMSVDELEALLGVDLPRGDWVSVGGLIIGLTGRIPVPGDSVSAGGYRFEVKRAVPTTGGFDK
jgi:CBS domain containing-hemolysin-like protein